MEWSKLRTRLKGLVAPALRERLAVHQARYRSTREEYGRVWITLDRREIFSFDTAKYLIRLGRLEQELRSDPSITDEQAYRLARERILQTLRAAGEYDDYSALIDLEAYLSLSLDDALEAPSPLLRALAVVDRRLGKRRLRALKMEAEHPLVRELYSARCEAEGISVAV